MFAAHSQSPEIVTTLLEADADAKYMAYWNEKLGIICRSADEVDAALIGIHGAR